MNTIKYVGLDVHSATISIAVINDAGKLVMEAMIETQAAAVVDFVRGLQGSLQVTFEEGIQAAWLYDVLLPHVALVLVCDPRQLPRHKEEAKSDKIDARKLAEWLRLGAFNPVYHRRQGGLRTLREPVRSYLVLVKDTTRVMNRLKAVYRGRGIPAQGTRVYSPREREACLGKLPAPGVRQRTELHYRQSALLLPLHQQARKALLAESRKHPAQKVLRSIPALGPVRVAILMGVMQTQTPYRFRTKRQLWKDAGLALVGRSSGAYRIVQGQLRGSPKKSLILELNLNHNHDLKAIFKDGARRLSPGADRCKNSMRAGSPKGWRRSWHA